MLGAIKQGIRTGCESAQIFSRNPRGWAAKPLVPEDAAAFHQARQTAGLKPLAVHLPYLPNLASADESLSRKSINVLAEELIRSALLGADYLVAHPGHVREDDDREQALERVARAILQARSSIEDTTTTLLLETTSGQKGELGAAFEELAGIISDIEGSSSNPLQIGVCLDTAHIWAAGYDLSGPKGQEAVLDDFDRIIGLNRLQLIHLNDSLFGLGERRDRHAPVGKGRIGARAMARLVRHPRLSHLAGIMETPRQSEADDVENMARAKRWRRRRTATRT